MIGKRKRPGEKSLHSSPTARNGRELDTDMHTDDEAQAVFRRYFEDRFKPLAKPKAPSTEVRPVTPDATLDDGPEWHGLSNDEDDELGPEIVDYSAQHLSQTSEPPRAELKTFMTSKPPTATSPAPRAQDRESRVDTAGDDDAANVKHDIALQRLLQESALLDPSSSLAPSGANRHKAIDLRIQSLGSKTSVLTQEKMPLSHRRGIVAKAATREEKRRREAKANGIVLEKVKAPSKGRENRRERGVGQPGVGKFTGGTLRLSKRDVAHIQGPQKGPRKGPIDRRR
ncbi:MAG: hypothetical protein M1838_004025 [Thelocarpon superellum]|nr:MAG: hypothetical protein M1838_004025 [Thelocarpon superellum]